MNHAQLRSCERLHATATVATGPINVDSQDVRNLLDAAAHAYQTMEQMTNELRETKTQFLERAVVEPVPAPAAAVNAPVIVTPAAAGS